MLNLEIVLLISKICLQDPPRKKVADFICYFISLLINCIVILENLIFLIIYYYFKALMSTIYVEVCLSKEFWGMIEIETIVQLHILQE